MITLDAAYKELEDKNFDASIQDCIDLLKLPQIQDQLLRIRIDNLVSGPASYRDQLNHSRYINEFDAQIRDLKENIYRLVKENETRK